MTVRNKIYIPSHAYGCFVCYKIAEYEKDYGDSYIIGAYRVWSL